MKATDKELRNECSSYLKVLWGDELRVAAGLLGRLVKGRRDYGQLDVHDGRNWLEEWAQESMDGLVYLECEKIMKEDKK